MKADCKKKKKKYDEERKAMLPQNSLASPPTATVPPRLANVQSNTFAGSGLSLRQLTIPSFVSDDEFQSHENFHSERQIAN